MIEAARAWAGEIMIGWLRHLLAILCAAAIMGCAAGAGAAEPITIGFGMAIDRRPPFPRLWVQFGNIRGNDLEPFKGKAMEVILLPLACKSGDIVYACAAAPP
jgi:hypothetical protein